MAKSHELKQARATVHTRMLELRDLLKKEDRVMSNEERVQFDKMYDEKQSLDSQIKLQSEIEQEERAIAEKELPKKGILNDKEQEKEARAAINIYLRKGKNALTPEHRSILFNPTNGILIEERAQSASTANLGAELVREEYVNYFDRAMKEYGGMMQCARIIRTATGGSLPIPTIDDTANVGAILAENTADTVVDIPTAKVTYGAYKYTSKAIKIPVELLQDDSYNLVGEVPSLAGERIGRIFNTHATVGTASSQPEGVVVGATASGTTITADTYTRAKILDLIHSVDPAYRKGPNVKLMMNDRSLKQIIALAIGSSDDRPLWVPSMRDGAPSTIEGYEYVINQDMPDSDTSTNKCMLFGDFDKFVIRMVKDFTIRRTDDRHIEEFVTAFYGFARMDAKILKATAIKSLAVA